jgi:isocitrate lyase
MRLLLGGETAANVIFATIQDRRGRNILSIRDQNTFNLELRQKRLMTLAQLFLIHRYRTDSVHYVTPTDDNRRQTEGMKANGLFNSVAQEVGEIIVADVNQDRVRELLASDRTALTALIAKG